MSMITLQCTQYLIFYIHALNSPLPSLVCVFRREVRIDQTCYVGRRRPCYHSNLQNNSCGVLIPHYIVPISASEIRDEQIFWVHLQHVYNHISAQIYYWIQYPIESPFYLPLIMSFSSSINLLFLSGSRGLMSIQEQNDGQDARACKTALKKHVLPKFIKPLVGIAASV